LLVGYVDKHVFEKSEKMGRPFRNVAALMHEGKILGKVYKTLLPTYDVYDEHHYFEPSEKCQPIKFKGLSFGVTICEDIWSDQLVDKPLQDRNPVDELKEAGADVIINMSASAFQIGKPQFKANLLEVVACGTSLPLVYCNAVGGNDQFIFDGHSHIIDGDGNELTDFPGFQQCIKVCDVTTKGHHAPIIRGRPIDHMWDALVLGIQDYAKKLVFDKAVVSLDDGVDSAVTAVLAVKALGKENVIAVTMPNKSTFGDSSAKDLAFAEQLGINCEVLPLTNLYKMAVSVLSGDLWDSPKESTESNMESRLRATLMMALSNNKGYFPLSSLNKSEMLVGNYAVYGDNSIGLSVLGDVPKKLVYQLAKLCNVEEQIIPQYMIDRGLPENLKVEQSERGILPPYKDLDNIIEYYVTYGLSTQEIIRDFGYKEEYVLWVQRRIDLNEWKRQQSPPVLRVSSPSSGRGRRTPIVQKFVE